MAQLVVRNLDDDVKAKLKEKAAFLKMPLEALVREILLEAALKGANDEFGLGSRIAERFRGLDLQHDELERLPSWDLQPATFDE